MSVKRTIFQAIEKHAKTEYGYAVINDVSQADPSKKNEMPSFFLAETYVSTKTLYLY